MQHMQIAFSRGIDVHLADLPDLLIRLVQNDTISASTASRVYDRSKRINANIEAILLYECGISEDQIAVAESQNCNVPIIKPLRFPPEHRLVQKASVHACLKLGLIPWRQLNGVTVILAPNKQTFINSAEFLREKFHTTEFAISTPSQIQKSLQHQGEEELAFEAETHLAQSMSCREISFGRLLWTSALLTIFVTLLWPQVVLLSTFYWVIFILVVTTTLKFVAMFSKTDRLTNLPPPQKLPTISLLIPLLKEKEVVGKLINHLQKLEYPRAKLEAQLIIEDDDETTLAALEYLPRPSWIKVIRAPIGVIRTKPRALNYALNCARGDIIGVYDAEDLPAADQLLSVATAFENSSENTACVQGTLDYYNDRSNWLSRCFTIEYASWFRVVLPGFARLGFLVPLGGTTLFFKRKVLENLGGWDAHNVTEDADLGVRLARFGYQTVFINSVTNEEANARLWPWIKQRSRWLKGYAVTYVVHMRNPAQLLKDLGLWKFCGFQMLFLGTLSQFVLAPLLWSTLVVPFGFSHPVLAIGSTTLIIALSALFLCCTAVNIAVHCIGAHRAGKRWLMLWTPTLLFYFPLGTLGALKGMFELIRKPFFWDKTEHGIDPPN